MRKIFIFISVLLFLSLSHTKALYAESDCSNIETNPTELTQNSFPTQKDQYQQLYTFFDLNFKVKDNTSWYTINVGNQSIGLFIDPSAVQPEVDGILHFQIKENIAGDIPPSANIFYAGDYQVTVLRETKSGLAKYCEFTLHVNLPSYTPTATPTPIPSLCKAEFIPQNQLITSNTDVYIKIIAYNKNTLEQLVNDFARIHYSVTNSGGSRSAEIDIKKEDIQNGYDGNNLTPYFSITKGLGRFNQGERIDVILDAPPSLHGLRTQPCGEYPIPLGGFIVGQKAVTSTPILTLTPKGKNLKKLEQVCEENILRPEDYAVDKSNPNTSDPLKPRIPKEVSIVTGASKKRLEEYNACKNCVKGEGEYKDNPGAWTAIGCLPTNISSLFKKYIFTIGLGLAGGIGFLLIVWGAFTILISGGNPEAINRGREIIVSAIAGLLLIIFSVLILRIIGVDIIQLPGFG